MMLSAFKDKSFDQAELYKKITRGSWHQEMVTKGCVLTDKNNPSLFIKLLARWQVGLRPAGSDPRVGDGLV